MSADDRVRQTAEFYRRYRIDEQRDFYERRAAEYDDASRQLSGATTFLLMIAAAAGALGVAEFGLSRARWGIVAAACSALVTVLAGWGTLIGFQQNAKLYRGGSAALRRLRGPLADHPADRAMLLTAVVQAEEVLQSETGQWGQQLTGSAAQLASHLRQSAPADPAAGGRPQPTGEPGPDPRTG